MTALAAFTGPCAHAELEPVLDGGGASSSAALPALPSHDRAEALPLVHRRDARASMESPLLPAPLPRSRVSGEEET